MDRAPHRGSRRPIPGLVQDVRTEQCVNSSGQSIASPLVRGVLAAVITLGTAIALTVIPALAAQVAGTRSSATALDAILIGLNLLVLGHGGGITLSTGVIDGTVTLTPFGLMALLVLVCAISMRRVGHVLELVDAETGLRPRALGDAGSALGAYTVVYAIGVGVLAALGRSADASPMIVPAIVSGALVAVVGGLSGVLWSLARRPTATSPGVRVLDLLPVPFDAVARAVLLAMAGLVAVGALAATGQLLLGIQDAAALFGELEPGIVGGIVLTLLQLALLPLLMVWALVILSGGTVTMGTGTAYSLEGVQSGVMPALPMLAALPQPGPAPAWAMALMALPLIPLVLGAVRLVRDTLHLERRDRITAWVAYPLVTTVAVLLLAGLSTGGIGDGRLVHLGPRMGTLLLPLLLLAVGATAAVLAIMATPLVPWVRASVASLRDRVESAEQKERAEKGAVDAQDTAGMQDDVVDDTATDEAETGGSDAEAEPADTEPADTEPADTEPADTEPDPLGVEDDEEPVEVPEDEVSRPADR